MLNCPVLRYQIVNHKRWDQPDLPKNALLFLLGFSVSELPELSDVEVSSGEKDRRPVAHGLIMGICKDCTLQVYLKV